MVIGVISDTHGLVRPEAMEALAGVDRILHAGDIGKKEVLDALGTVAQVISVRGNNDTDPWARKVPERVRKSLGGVRFLMVHDLKTLEGDHPRADVVVAGHSHKPGILEKDGTLFVNPGSAGPRRFKLPVTLARVEIGADKSVRARIINLLR